MIHGSYKGLVAGSCCKPLALAKVDEFTIDFPFVLLLVILIFFVNELVKNLEHRFLEPWLSIPTFLHLWQQTNIPAAKGLCCFSILCDPVPNSACWYGTIGKMLAREHRLNDSVATLCLFQRRLVSLHDALAYLLAEASVCGWLCESHQFSCCDECLEMGMGQFHWLLIFCQEGNGRLSLIQNGTAPTIPYNRCSRFNEDGMWVTHAEMSMLFSCN